MSTVVRLRGPLSPTAVAQATASVAGPGSVVLVVEACDVTVVDAVARLRLLARRHGCALLVVGADRSLFEACGLADVLSDGSR